MAVQLPRGPSLCENVKGATGPGCVTVHEDVPTHKWYLTEKELETCSPSRKDGICSEQESHLRKLYCSFIQELGIELKVPQVTIATAMILCHRFYMRQSHAKNHWQIIAAASMFLACKAEDTPRFLNDFVVIAYKLMYKWDPSAPERIRQREEYCQQKEFIISGERLLLATVSFDLNVEQPYKPLVSALKKLDIPHKDIARVAWNFVNDWLQTTLCLQYKAPYIAAGSVFLAAKLLKVNLPKLNGNPWWMQFDVAPKQLEEALQHMHGMIRQKRKHMMTEIQTGRWETNVNSSASKISTMNTSVVDSRNSISKCIQKPPSSDVHNVIKEAEKFQPSNFGSTNRTVENGDGKPNVGVCDPNTSCKTVSTEYSRSKLDGKPKAGECDRNPSCKIVPTEDSRSKLDVNRIREMIKRRRTERNKELVENVKDEIDSETWIQRQIENEIQPLSCSLK